MLDNIKSNKILKEIFKFIIFERKLKIVNYNKTTQNRLYINIIFYKIFSKRFIEYLPNGKINEINSYDNSLIFQGELLNGKRNGKGKEYYSNSNILCDGNYLNGKRNGEGKEFLLSR